MERIYLATILLDTVERVFWIGASWASIRAVLGIVARRVESAERTIMWVRAKALSRVTYAEVMITVLATILMAAGAELRYVVVREGVYWARDVEPRLKEAAKERRRPEGPIIVAPIVSREATWPGWMSDHVFWLEKEGDRDKSSGLIGSYVIGKAEHVVTSATKAAELVIHVDVQYSIWSRSAFRVIRSTPSLLAERLDVRAEEGFRELRIAVPACDEGEVVIVLFRLGTRTPDAPTDIGRIVTRWFE